MTVYAGTNYPYTSFSIFKLLGGDDVYAATGEITNLTATITINSGGVVTGVASASGDVDASISQDPDADAITGGRTEVIESLSGNANLSGSTSDVIASWVNGNIVAKFEGHFENANAALVGSVTFTDDRFSGLMSIPITLSSILSSSMISIDSYTGIIGERHGPISVHLSRSFDVSSPASVDVQLVDGTALIHTNYESSTGNNPIHVEFAAGQTEATVFVAPIDDFVIDTARDFQVRLVNAVGATLGANTADITITDEDQPPSYPALPQGTLVLTAADGTIVPIENPGQGKVMFVAAGSIVGATISYEGGNHVTYAAPLSSGTGNKFLAGSGIDKFYAGSGSNTYIAGTGSTTVDYSYAPGPVVVNLQSGQVSNGFGGTDTLTNIGAVTGSHLNDTFIVGSSSSILDGNGGVDTVVFAGNRSDYSVLLNADGSLSVAKGGVADDVLNFSFLKFSDQTIATTNNSGAVSIAELYIGYFDRAPDPSGQSYWVNQLDNGMPLTQIAQSYSVQPEATNLYPFLASPNTASTAAVEDFITAVYTHLFNRGPDASGEAYWANQLQTGASTVGAAIINIVSGAQGTDSATISNKVTVGDYFDSEVFAHNVKVSVAAAQSIMSGVTSSPSTVVSAEALVDSYVQSAPHVSEVTIVGTQHALQPST